MTQFHRLGSVAQRGFWWARDYLDAGIAVGRSYLSRTPASSFEVGRDDLPIVVILPGVYEPWRFQLPLIRGLHARGYRVRVVEDLRDNRVAVRTGATIAQKVVDRVAAGPGSVVLVAHSKGGLIGKRLLLDAGEDSPLIGLVAVATPFAGSVLARLTPGRTLSELRPTSQTIQGLADEAANAKRVEAVEHWAEERSKGLYATSRVSDDGMIDPRDTRTVLGIALSACHNKAVVGTKEYGTWRM